MTVQIFYRKRNPIHFSIESLFDNLHQEVEKENDVDISKIEMPHYSTSQISLVKNIQFAKANQKQINHISGDIHYVALGLQPEKTILTIHDCVTLTKQRNPLKQWFVKKMWYDWPVKRVAQITVISEKTKQELIQHTSCNPDKIAVISNFYDPIFKRKEYKFNKSKPRILQVGTRDNKNLERVIEAIAHLNTTLVIVGGLSNSQNELLNRNNIDYEVHVGISKEALLREYERCDILSFVSTYEGFGMPIIESQAVGRPVLTSELEPMKSVAGNGALLVDPYSVDSIRRGFERLLEETEIRSRLIREGFENVKRFSIESVSKQYLNLYKKLAN